MTMRKRQAIRAWLIYTQHEAAARRKTSAPVRLIARMLALRAHNQQLQPAPIAIARAMRRP
jgi:hypothetical protein